MNPTSIIRDILLEKIFPEFMIEKGRGGRSWAFGLASCLGLF